MFPDLYFLPSLFSSPLLCSPLISSAVNSVFQHFNFNLVKEQIQSFHESTICLGLARRITAQ